MSEVDSFEYPEGFKLPYENAEARNDELQVKADIMNERVILAGVQEVLK